MKVVLDTNIILGSISPFSKYRLVMDRFEKGDYILCLTTEIMLEYEEKLSELALKLIRENMEKHRRGENATFLPVRLVARDLGNCGMTEKT